MKVILETCRVHHFDIYALINLYSGLEPFSLCVMENNSDVFCGFTFMVFNATFNNISAISWLSVLLVEETGGPGENHQPVASY